MAFGIQVVCPCGPSDVRHAVEREKSRLSPSCRLLLACRPRPLPCSSPHPVPQPQLLSTFHYSASSTTSDKTHICSPRHPASFLSTSSPLPGPSLPASHPDIDWPSSRVLAAAAACRPYLRLRLLAVVMRVSACVPSATACFLRVPGSTRRTACITQTTNTRQGPGRQAGGQHHGGRGRQGQGVSSPMCQSEGLHHI